MMQKKRYVELQIAKKAIGKVVCFTNVFTKIAGENMRKYRTYKEL